jgi:hypothetical protein
MANGKQRHGCLTAWLVLIIVVNALTALTMPSMMTMMRQYVPNLPDWVLWPLVLCGVLNVIFALALFKWKRWGFYGFLLTTVVALAINISSGLSIGRSLVGLLGVAILYAVLQIGGPMSAWNQLE